MASFITSERSIKSGIVVTTPMETAINHTSSACSRLLAGENQKTKFLIPKPPFSIFHSFLREIQQLFIITDFDSRLSLFDYMSWNMALQKHACDLRMIAVTVCG